MMQTVKNTRKRSADFLALVYFLVGVIGIGLFLVFLTRPDVWYANLVKPSFTPTNVFFMPVWTLLYIMIAVAGWRIWRVAAKSIAMGLWVIQMVLIGSWSFVFFMEHQPGKALVIITLLFITVLIFIIQSQKYDKVASRLLMPYAVWIGFAATLNTTIFALN